jgi:tetratricopeptide (TPR) repeat protein
MWHKRALVSCTFLIVFIAVPVEAAETLSYKTFPITVLVNHEIVSAEGEPLPADLLNILLPINHQDCKQSLFFPEAEITRVDVQPSYTISFEEVLDPARLEEEASNRFLNALQRRMGIKPDAADIQKVAQEKLLAIKAEGNLASPAPSAASTSVLERHTELIERMRGERLIVTPGLDDPQLLNALKEKGVEVKVVGNPAKVSAELGRMLCMSDSASAGVPRFVVWYKPAAANIPSQSKGPNKPQPEAVQNVRQGLTYISLAKGARGAQEKRENYRNAEASFNAAIDSEAKRGGCYANAYMNRGLVYALQDKPSLALRDLTKAVECDPEDATIRYNLAAVHSLAGDKDLSIEALDAALERGFSDCNALRDDPDLKNVRKVPEYKETLEKHRLFCF